MIRLVGYLTVILTLSVALAWLSASPGTLSLEWRGWRVDTSVAFLFGVFLLASTVLAGLFMLLRTLSLGPQLLQRRIRERSAVLGLKLITESMVALAAGDLAQARKQISKAKRYVGDAPIILLLSAQMAKLEGNEQDARALMEDMLEHSETRYLAARSLSDYHDRRNQSAQAFTHAQEALRLKPRDFEALARYVSHATQLGRWQEALQAVHKAMLWLPRKERRRLEGIVYLMRAEALEAEHDVTTALSFARNAYKRLSDFPPAAALLAVLSDEAKDTQEAVKAVRQTWKHAAHPQLSAAFFRVTRDMAPEARLKAARAVAKTLSDHAESHLLLARAAIMAKAWLEARAELNIAVGIHESARAGEMMSEVERDGFDDLAAAAKWITRAKNAGEAPAWVCTACGIKQAQWSVHCGGCHAFDAFTWKVPVLRYVR